MISKLDAAISASRREATRNWVFVLLFTATAIYAASRLQLSLDSLPAGAARLGWLVGLMLPPQQKGHLPDFLQGIGETLSIALLGTGLAAAIALPFGFLGSHRVMPVAAIRFTFRRLFDLLRGIDTLIWGLMFVSALGLGPFAGVLAIACSEIGTLSKLFADAIDNADRRPSDGLRSSGANAIEVARFGILPEVGPVFLSHALYYLESNTRSASILGIVGAGGIGLQLSDRIRANEWQQVAFILLLILAAVSLLDFASDRLRRRLIYGQ